MAAPLLFVSFQLQQSFQKEVLAVDQHAITRTGAAAMTKNPWRRRISFAYWRKIVINQRLRDALAFLAIQRSLLRVGNLAGKTEQPTSDNGRRRSVAVAIVHAGIVKVIPGNSIFRQFADYIVRNFYCGRERDWIMCCLVRFAEAIERPPGATRPCGS